MRNIIKNNNMTEIINQWVKQLTYNKNIERRKDNKKRAIIKKVILKNLEMCIYFNSYDFSGIVYTGLGW